MSEVSSIAASLSKGAGKFPLMSVVPSDVLGRVFTGARAISETSVSALSDSVARAFTGFRSTSESLASAIAASVSKGAGKFPLLSVVPSDVMGRVFTGFRTLSETPTLSDAASRAFTGFRTTSENLASAISGVVNKGVARSISVVVSIAASVRKDVGKFPLETLVPSDVASRVFTGARAISEDSVSTVSDTVIRAFTGFRSTSENLASAIAASVRKDVGKFPLLSVVPSDVVGRVITGGRAISENSVVAVSDSVISAFTGFRSASENLATAIAASVRKGAAKFPLLSVVPSDVVGRVITEFRTLSETPSVSDAADRVFTGFRTTSESLASAIAASVSKGAGKFPLLSVVPSDVVGRVFTGFRTLSETPSVSDAADRVFTGFRTTSESLASAISGVVNKGVARSISEVVSIADSVRKGAGKFPLESVVPSDVVGRIFTGARAISENSLSVVSDSVIMAFTGFRSTSENLASAIADSVSKNVGKSLSEAPPISDTTSRLFNTFRGLTESTTVSDAIARFFTGLGRGIAEAPIISDATSRAFTGFRTTSENLASTISDVVNKGVARSISEVVSIADSVSKGAGKFPDRNSVA